MNSQLLSELKQVFIKVFKDTDHNDFHYDLKMNDIPQWDSLANFNFLMTIEEHFEIQFDINDMSDLNSIRSIYEKIEHIKKYT